MRALNPRHHQHCHQHSYRRQKKMDRTREGAVRIISSIKDVVPPKELFNVFIIPTVESADGWQRNLTSTGSKSAERRWGIVSDPSCNIFLPHNTTYSVGVLNMSTHPIEAALNIDGKSMGTFHAGAYSFIDIRRSVRDDKCFIFKSVCDTSPASRFAIGNITSQFRGEVRVDIRPREHGNNLQDHVRVFTPSPEEEEMEEEDEEGRRVRRRKQKYPRRFSGALAANKRFPPLPYEFEEDGVGAGSDVVDTATPPPPPPPAPEGGNIFTGLVETDFGAGETGRSLPACASAPPLPPPMGTNVRITDQGFTGFGKKTYQEFNQVQKMKTKGLHIFVNFLKLGDLGFNVLQDIKMFT